MAVTGKSKQALVGQRLNAVILQPLKKTNTAGLLGDAAQTSSGGGTAALGDGTTYFGFALADGAAFTGYVEDVEFDQEWESEDSTMLGQANASEVLGVHRATCTLTEILRYRSWSAGNGTGTRQGNFLSYAFNNAQANADGDDNGARDVLVTIRRGGETFAFYGLMKSYRESYRKGKSVGVMTITCSDGKLDVNQNPPVANYTQGSGTKGS